MNSLVEQVSDDNVLENIENLGPIEIAAPRSVVITSPLEMVKKSFFSIVVNSHGAFRVSVVASLLNEKAADVFQTQDIGGITGFDLNALVSTLDPAKIRESLVFNAGDGKKRPVSVSFLESLYNIPQEIVDKILAFMPVGSNKNHGVPFGQFIETVAGFGVLPVVAEQFEQMTTMIQEQYIEKLKDFCDLYVKVSKKVFNEQNETYDLDFELYIDIDPTIYPEVVDSDEFSPYLMSLWVHNSLTNSDRRGAKITDPRKVAAHAKSMQKFTQVRPKVNKDNFCVWENGLIMYIPENANYVDNFLKIADTCIDENGNYDRNQLVEKHNLNNKIIYVDWVNDIMAYTSNTGRLTTLNLGNVVALDPSTEFSFLSSAVSKQPLVKFMRSISASFPDIDMEAASKFTDDPDVKAWLSGNSGERIYSNVITARSVFKDFNDDVKLLHLCGAQLNEFDEPSLKPLLTNIKAFKCIIQQLYSDYKKDPSALKVPSDQQSQGIFYQIVGVAYLLKAISSYDDKHVDTLRNEYRTEREKTTVTRTKQTFDIPNVKLGVGGLMGLLPHQGRIGSSLIKTPKRAMLPIQTGGGKTIVSAMDAIYGIKNLKIFPMITTKGNLVKGTITELNAITHGKINAVPLRVTTLRRMMRTTGIRTFVDFLKWYRTLPPNTIFVNAYSDFSSRRKIYEDLETVVGFADAPVWTTQYLLIIKLLGIRMFIGDESHMVKNPKSARSRNSYAAFSQGDVTHIMSGTMVSSTVLDLVGQARAVSPFIFGADADHFAEMYGVSKGLIKNDEDAKIIKDRMKETTAYHEATREDWSYMLPLKEDEIIFATMTPLQMEFYNVLMQEAMLLLLESMKSKKKVRDPEADEDDEDEEEDEEDEGDDEDAEENAFIAKAKVHLQKVEAFLVAPDSNEQYMQWERRPAGDDLISPKVKLADKIITDHLLKNRGNMSENKIMILGWNKVASVHFMKYSIHAQSCLHYTAGDEEVMRKFEKDPAHHILVGDETSIREGFNLQMVSLILRQQAVWSPGDHEQTLARMYRPDPRGKYNRAWVRHVWLMNELPGGAPTLDGAKMARLVSKSVSNARLTYEGRREWKSVSSDFDDLQMLKMNLQLIFQSTKDDFVPYFGSWKTFVRWENEINTNAKATLARALEQQSGEDLVDENGNIRDINRFIKLAMSEVVSTQDIPGSKRVYVPWIPNAIPADPDNWGYQVMGSQEVANGTVVYTEFGPAIITGILNKGVKCQIYDGRVIGLKKNAIMLVDPAKYSDFAKIVSNPSSWAKASFDVWGVKQAVTPAELKRRGEDNKQNADEDEEVITSLDDDEDTDDAEKVELDITPTIINGWPAMIIMDDLEELSKLDGWKRVDPFTTISFRNWQAAEKFLELLDDKTAIPDKVYEDLQEEMKDLRAGKAMVLGKQINSANFRNFFQTQRKKLGKNKEGRFIVNPYFIAIENEIKIAFDTNSHDAKVISWLLRMKEKMPTVKQVKKNDAIWINIFNSIREAVADIENLSKLGDVDERDIKLALRDIKDEIALLKKPRTRPQF